MATAERVFALHDFDAENPDEVSFKAGEPVIVVEKDDAYGDGWWQGTNTKGETGLFPFSYTTYDAEVAKGSALGDKGVAGAGANGKVMNSTMADIDEALAGLRTGNGAQAKGLPADRRSMNSERTGDYSVGETDEGGNAEEDFEARARARAALAVNAARDQEGVDAAEKAEQARMKAQAQRTFEEEEEKQRQLLLKREEERKIAAAQGTLQQSEKPKVAPISGLDMSDESDSEGSEGGRDYDDAVAPTHAPLFGGPATSPSGGTAGASEALRSVASLSSSNQMPGALEQHRNLSPIASASTHSQGRSPGQGGQTALFAGASAAAAAAAGSVVAAPALSNRQSSTNQSDQGTRSFDQGSINSSKGRTSTAADSAAVGGNNGSSTMPSSTSIGGGDTPKSQTPFNQGSPNPSVGASRTGGPGGDPHEWSVDQVVEWARSKGWDENQVVSKFAEHEISGDVLLEMDVNILKEIEITAFGKRYQVANAIKDLNRSLQGPGDTSANSWSAMPDATASPSSGMAPGSFQLQQQKSMGASSETAPSNHSHQAAAAIGAGGAGLAAAGLASQMTTPSHFDIVPDQRSSSGNGWTQQPMMPLDQSAPPNDGYAAAASLAPGGYRSVPGRNVSQYESIYSNMPPSPKKRESISSASGKTSGDRTSFFANFQPSKGRKAAPKTLSPGVPMSEADNNRGTLSRLGLNRLRAGSIMQQEPTSPNQDIRNKISLPTGSPTYDAMGDTARRNRISHQSNGSGNDPLSSSRGGVAGVGPGMGGMGNHQKQASIGSAGPNAADYYAPPPNRSDPPPAPSAEGAVMGRIRPVDYEGWMRKKGERYNSWKPRYLALKGSDLVLLRDPSASKIKGYVSMKGYKVIADENTNPGKYGFKILHETEKPHYFSSDDGVLVRDWMKALMKATIDRDTSLPVISSYNNPTISLKEAQKMNPPPRPPSPTSVARAQRARARGNKDELTAKDASVLMGVQQANENGRRGFIALEELSPGTKQGHYKQSSIGYNQGRSLQNVTIPREGGSQGWQVSSGASRRKIGGDMACVSPVEQVAPWVLREDKETVLYAGNPPPEVFDPTRWDHDDDDDRTLHDIKMKITNLPKKVAPLRTHGLLPGQGSLPMLATPPHQGALSRGDERSFLRQEGYSAGSLTSPPPPLPLPKSGQSDTMGCADLPPPPPPSHSPDHKYRIQSLLQRGKKAPKQPWFDMPLPPTPNINMQSPMAPTPISKGMNSASSYPTVSDSALPSSARVRSLSPPSASASSRLAKKAGKRFLRDSGRPRSAGGEDLANKGSLRSPASMGPSSVGGAVKNSFIVFSVNRGTSVDPRASIMTDDTRAGHPQQQQNSASEYSNNESVFMGSPPYATISSPGYRGSNVSNYVNMGMIPPAPKSAAALPSYIPTATKQDKAHYIRSSSFDGFSRPTKENLRQETMNKPSWFKMTRDRDKKRMTEVESKEKMLEAEREIQEHDLEEEEEEEEECFEEQQQQQNWYHQKNLASSSSRQEGMEWPGSAGGEEASSAGGDGPLYQRQRCLSDQPYAGMLTLSPGMMSPSVQSPLSPPSHS